VYVFAVAEDPGKLYNYRSGVLNWLRQVASRDVGFHVNCVLRVLLFRYDNGAFMVHNINDAGVDVDVVFDVVSRSIVELAANTNVAGVVMSLRVHLALHQFRVFVKIKSFRKPVISHIIVIL
jgi:hypothetical protein